MIIHVYTFCRDEELLLPFFLEHYNFADRITVFYDRYSKDNSLALINASPNCIRIDFDFGGKYRDDFLMYAKNSEWKMSRGSADWVIVVDMDEFIYHPDSVLTYLTACDKQGVTLPLTDGYEMHDDNLPFPEMQITEQIKFGAPSKQFCKQAVFKPNEIDNIFYLPGSHQCKPEGKIIYSDSKELKLLHYKFIGGLERIKQRWNTFGDNLSKENIKYGWSIKRKKEEEAIKRYHEIRQRKTKII